VKPELSLRESYHEHKLEIFYGKIKIDMNKESKESIRHFASLDSFSTLNPVALILSSLYSATYAVIHTQSHRSPSFTVCHLSSHRPQLLSSDKNPRIDDATRHGESDWCRYCLRCGSSPGYGCRNTSNSGSGCAKQGAIAKLYICSFFLQVLIRSL
jgi:hypothetical protein